MNKSKYLAYLLRHHPGDLSMDEYGYVPIEEILVKLEITEEELIHIVNTDNKQRYRIKDKKIRANQGHSIPIKMDFDEVIPPEFLYHGTSFKSKESIDKQGLLPMSRQYVHLSKSIEEAIKVGQRHGKPYIYQINTEEMIKDGYIFYISYNHVYLIKEVPAKYLRGIKK